MIREEKLESHSMVYHYNDDSNNFEMKNDIIFSPHYSSSQSQYIGGSIFYDTPHNQQWHHSHNDDKDHLDLPHLNLFDDLLCALFNKSTHEMGVV